jgi:meiotically up-regulated gene 157 (Mug157) protein
MAKYAVIIAESISHYIEVEADSEEEAIEEGKELIGNYSDETLEKDYAYAVDSIGWDGYGDAEIIP